MRKFYVLLEFDLKLLSNSHAESFELYLSRLTIGQNFSEADSVMSRKQIENPQSSSQLPDTRHCLRHV